MARLDPTGVSRILTYIKTWITGLLSNKSDASHTHSDYVPKSGGGVLNGTPFSRTVSNEELRFDGGAGWDNGASLSLSGKDRPDHGLAGAVLLRASDGSQSKSVTLYPDGDFVWNDSSTAKRIAMREDTIPRSVGAVITGYALARIDDVGFVELNGGTGWHHGAGISLRGKDCSAYDDAGCFHILASDGTHSKALSGGPNGTLSWDGQPIQYPSDQRLKQQISNIDDKLLDAWEDVLPCQFKYNDAVNEKGDNARLHTGYVVQQIDEGCKAHNLDISEYGLYCHEEYPEETEEVEVEQEDGTKIKERKVIREASEHYSLRYTETLVVECAYLRREVKRLSERLEKLEK